MKQKSTKRLLKYSIFIMGIAAILLKVVFQSFIGGIFFKEELKSLTGYNAVLSEEYEYSDWDLDGFYSIEVFSLNSKDSIYFEKANQTFFENYPKEFPKDKRWTRTPILDQDKEVFKYITMSYGGWSEELIEINQIVINIGQSIGSYYTHQYNNGTTCFYLISPKDKKIIKIGEMM